MIPEHQIRIILADDHMVVRKGLHHVLEAAPDLQVIDEADSGEAVLYLCQKHKPDVVLMDVQMEGMGGLEATRLLVLHHPNVRVIGLSTFAAPQVVADMVTAGASGYVLKDISADELVEAIRRVHAGETVFSPAVSAIANDPDMFPGEPEDADTVITMGAQQ